MATLTKKLSPIARMKAEHKDKETLVDHILDVVERGETDKDTLKAKLLGASNSKLLRLFDAAREVKTTFGSKEKLAEATATAIGKAKDKDFVGRIAKFAPSRLLSIFHAASPKAKVEAKTQKSKAAKAPVAAKAKAKAPAKAKTASK